MSKDRIEEIKQEFAEKGIKLAEDCNIEVASPDRQPINSDRFNNRTISIGDKSVVQKEDPIFLGKGSHSLISREKVRAITGKNGNAVSRRLPTYG